MRQYFMFPTLCLSFASNLPSRVWLGILCSATMSYSTLLHAQTYSYQDAEQQLLEFSNLSQSQALLTQAAQLEQQALKGLGLPQVNLNARAYAFHNEVDVPLDQFKQHVEDQLSQRVSGQLSELEQTTAIPPQTLDRVQQGMNSLIQQGVAGIPNYANLTVEDQVFRPTISIAMPVYTAGLTQSAKTVAEINTHKSQLTLLQQQELQRLNLIQSYFNVQLQRQLLITHQHNVNAMQKHLSNAQKLEQQGLISKGQRMQFEVAYNNAQRLFLSNQNQLLASEYSLKSLLQVTTLERLSTPLFIHLNATYPASTLSNTVTKPPILQQLQQDQLLLDEKINVQNAKQKPQIFAFGEYALDNKQNWIVGLVASYQLFSGIDQNKQRQATQLQKQATELLSQQTQQELERSIFTASTQMTTAQQNHLLLKQNMLAAQENLRIQTLAFKEDMATASQVIDAENALYQLQSEVSLNAYRYIMALATLLSTQGQTEQFKQSLHATSVEYIQN